MTEEMTERRYVVTASDNDRGARLDRLLAAALPSLSRSRIKALIEDGRVTRAGAVLSEASARVKPGERFVLDVPAPRPARPEAEPIPLVVLFEDAHLIVIDKPAGLVVHPAPGNPGQTLVNALLAHCGGSLSGIGGVARPGIVHRLDKDTSGVLVAAKTDTAHAGLARQFAAHSIERRYRAIVHGVPTPAEGRIGGAIGRSRADRKKMAVVERGGKSAVTHYRVLRRFGAVASLVECRLETGRTHQIRVHFAHSGHPLVGDGTYRRRRKESERSIPAEAAKALESFGRQALHAYLLGFRHPVTGKIMRFVVAAPPDLETLVRSLELIQKMP